MSGFANPADLERLAQDCDNAAIQIDSLAGKFSTSTGDVFKDWKGAAADSLRAVIQPETAALRDAQTSLRNAATALRQGAGEVREAIRREEERLREEAAQRAKNRAQ